MVAGATYYYNSATNFSTWNLEEVWQLSADAVEQSAEASPETWTEADGCSVDACAPVPQTCGGYGKVLHRQCADGSAAVCMQDMFTRPATSRQAGAHAEAALAPSQCERLHAALSCDEESC